jgi:hypothetical protein
VGEEHLAVLAADEAAVEARRAISARGRVTQSYGPRVLVFEARAALAKRLAAHRGVLAISRGAVPSEVADDLDETGRMGVAAWNQRHDPRFRAAKAERAGEGLSWDRPPGAERGGRPGP